MSNKIKQLSKEINALHAEDKARLMVALDSRENQFVGKYQPVTDEWKTIKGARVEIDDKTGEIKRGMGGKFTGTKLSEIRKSFVGPKTPKGHSTKPAENTKPATTKAGGLANKEQAKKATPASRKSRIREVGNNFLKNAKQSGINVDGVGKPQINALSNGVESSFAQRHVNSDMKFSAERGGRHDFDARYFFKGKDLETLEESGLVKNTSGRKYRFTEKGAHIASQMFAYGDKG